MDSISISRSNTENEVSKLAGMVQTEIIDAGAESGNQIINVIDNSTGDFVDSLKEEIEQEVKLIHELGELLIAMTNYIQSAAAAFEDVDHTYNTSKLQ